MTQVALALFALLSSGDPRGLDPTRVHEFVVAPARIGGRSAASLLPRRGVVRWRVRVAGGIVHAPSAALDGSILVAHAQPTIAEYDPAGRLRWTARLGANPAAASPITLADGTWLVLTEGAEAVCFSERGALLWSRQLPIGSFGRAPLLASTHAGSVLVADGRRLLRLDGTGRLAHLTVLDQEASALLGPPGPPLVVGSSGAVFEILPDGRPRRRGDFGARTDAVARLDARRLLAVVAGRKLVVLDLEKRALEVRFSDDNLDLGPGLAVNGAGEARVLARPDLLLAFGEDGQERFRAPLAASFAAGATLESSEVTLDAAGNAIVVRSGTDAISVLADGSVVRIEATACAEPLRPVALPGRSALLACRSGVLARADEP